MVDFANWPDDQLERLLSIRDKIVPIILSRSRQALRTAGLEATIVVKRHGERIEIGIQSALSGDDLHRAEEIVETVLTATLLGAAGRLN